MEEIWKGVVGYEDKYLVSNFGNIQTVPRNVLSSIHKTKTRNIKARILTPCDNGNGYKYFGIRSSKTYCKHIYIHKAVAIAFLENPNNHTDVNHIDCDKSNNAAVNLEWCSKSHNMKHAFDNGLMNTVRGVNKWGCKLTEDNIREIRRLVKDGVMHKEIAPKFGISAGYVWHIMHDKWQHIQ